MKWYEANGQNAPWIGSIHGLGGSYGRHYKGEKLIIAAAGPASDVEPSTLVLRVGPRHLGSIVDTSEIPEPVEHVFEESGRFFVTASLRWPPMATWSVFCYNPSLITQLKTDIVELDLALGVSRPLIQKLQEANEARNAPDHCEALDTFIDMVSEQRGSQLTGDQVIALSTVPAAIIRQLGAYCKKSG